MPAGTVLAQRYEVRQVIGRGGMGVVVEALDRTLGVAVAIKIVRAEYAAERAWSERLAREVKLARQLQHPNVCRVFDYAQSDGRAFLIMELASGGTLRDELGSGVTRTRSLAARLDDARAIAGGLAAIHAAGIVHRDISPQNALRMSDGRLVLSDFGLATDSLDGSTSLHGGTVAYMAPEVLRGGRAGFASDMWSLGAVIHETVFGERLAWDPDSKEMRSAFAGRKLTSAEQGVFELCRACMASNPERRARDAGAIAAQLSAAGLARTAMQRGRKRAGLAVAAALVAIAGVSGVRHLVTGRRQGSALAAASHATTPVDPLMIIPTGEPEDWTDKSRVLAEVPDRIRCMVPLPDHHTVRIVWGYPARAEDLDTHTRKRVPSPLVPAAYAEGCPDLSRDGKRLVYAGHTADDRAFAFVSPHPDGSDALPEIQTAEPTMNSDPAWLPDGESFVYDADWNHAGVFFVATKHAVVLPTTSRRQDTFFHGVLGDEVFVNVIFSTGEMWLTGWSASRLAETTSFHLASPVLDLATRDGRSYYSINQSESIVEMEPARHRAQSVGKIGGQILRYPTFVDGGLLFASVALKTVLVLRAGQEIVGRVPVDDVLWATACNDKIIAAQFRGPTMETVLMTRKGEALKVLASARQMAFPRCSNDGRLMFYATLESPQQIMRCEDGRCQVMFAGESDNLSLSPDSARLAFVETDNRGRTVRWIDTNGHGIVRDVATIETGCAPVWSTNRDLWIALRRGRQVIWTEMDTDSARPTGRTSLGTRDCSNRHPDPAAPVKEAVEVEEIARWQIRLLAEKFLPAH